MNMYMNQTTGSEIYHGFLWYSSSQEWDLNLTFGANVIQYFKCSYALFLWNTAVYNNDIRFSDLFTNCTFVCSLYLQLTYFVHIS